MATNLTEAVSAVRSGNLLSKLKIDGALYNIKDPAVETLAAAIDTAFANLDTTLAEKTTWTAVSKGGETKKYATVVEQGTDGAITVTYGNLRDTALAKANNAKKFTTSVTQDVDGVVSATYDDALTSDVKRTATTSDTTHNGLAATDLEAALQELDALLKSEASARATADTNLIGASTDAASADTIWGAKNYAQEKINELAGTDWTAAAGTVKNIIDELSQGGNADFTTVVDKIRGDFTSTKDDVTTTDIKSYIDNAVATVQTQATGGISALDAEVTSNDGTNVQVKVTEVDGVITAVNVTTDNTINETDLADKVGDIGNVTVKSYVDTAVANKNVSATGDTYVSASAADNGVTVAATQKTQAAVAAAETSIQSLTVNNQTATISGNANAKAASVTIYGDQINLTSTNGTSLTAAIATKANKNAIATGQVNNWTANYINTNNEETLEWTNTVTSVYIPVANQSL